VLIRRTSRRAFLRESLAGLSVAATFPAFLRGSARAALAAPPAARRDSPVLVVLQLAGGNDGLNTLVPWTNDFYHRARPTLAISKAEVLRLDAEYGLHRDLSDLADLFRRGLVAAVHGVGYPNPNRSHFRSTEVWHAGLSDPGPRTGWIGRYFDANCRGEHPVVGVAVESTWPLALAGPTYLGVSFRDPGRYRIPPDMPPHRPDAIATGSEALDFLTRIESNARTSVDAVREFLASAKNESLYPESELGRDLSVVARLIAAGAPTRVFYASQSGYDTHARQQGAHESLLRDFSHAMRAFLDDLEAQGNLDRVLVLTFSEFGRRVAENGSGGTDHGVAAPVLLFGGGVRPGFHGSAPSLAPEDLTQGDLEPTVDFRSIYATVLDSWLGAPDEIILKGRFPKLDLLESSG
jgi:uncharacterized protein (DUF1501 family)